MPVRVNQFTIQAQFDDEDSQDSSQEGGSIDIHSLKEEILRECMEKVENYIERREKR